MTAEDSNASLGEVKGILTGFQGTLADIQTNMVRKDVLATWQSDVNGQIAGLRAELTAVETRANQKVKDADDKAQRAIDELGAAQKSIDSAGKARVNMWITGGIALAGSALIKLLFPSP